MPPLTTTLPPGDGAAIVDSEGEVGESWSGVDNFATAAAAKTSVVDGLEVVAAAAVVVVDKGEGGGGADGVDEDMMGGGGGGRSGVGVAFAIEEEPLRFLLR